MFDQKTIYAMNNPQPADDAWSCDFCGVYYPSSEGFYLYPLGEWGKQCQTCRDEERAL